jgi:hypothetical protein
MVAGLHRHTPSREAKNCLACHAARSCKIGRANGWMMAHVGQYKADLLFRAVNLTGSATDESEDHLDHCFPRQGFLAHLVYMKAKMSQKSSIPQYAYTVSLVLSSGRLRTWVSTENIL